MILKSSLTETIGLDYLVLSRTDCCVFMSGCDCFPPEIDFAKTRTYGNLKNKPKSVDWVVYKLGGLLGSTENKVKIHEITPVKGSVGLILTKDSTMRISISLDFVSRSFIPLPRFIRSRRSTPLLTPSLVLFSP